MLRSNESFRDADWMHLRLDAIANDSGDVVVNVYKCRCGSPKCRGSILAPKPAD